MFSDESPWVIKEPGNTVMGQCRQQPACAEVTTDSMCLPAVLAAWERQALMGTSAEALVELVTVPLSPPLCLCRRVQQGSLPPALPVAGDE